MKKQIFKINIFLLSFLATMPTILIYAADEEAVLKNIANRVLDIVLWFAFAIAFGAIMFFGIKYMLSGANERANLKGMLPKYLIGFALIVLCFEIASGVAEIAGDDTADEIIDVGKEAGDYFSGGGNYFGDKNNGGSKDPLDQYYKDQANDNVDVNGNGDSNIVVPDNKPLTPDQGDDQWIDDFNNLLDDFSNNNKPDFGDANLQDGKNDMFGDEMSPDIINKKEPQKPPTGGFVPGRPSMDDLAGD